MSKPRLLLIHPAADKDRFGLRRRRRSSVPQLNLPLLAAHADDRFDVQIVDENIEDIDLDGRADLVGISIMTPTALRGYEIADACRRRGIPVVIGGMHAFFMREEAAQHADTLVVGEAEYSWNRLLDDFLAGHMEKTYSSEKLHDLAGLPKPRLDLLKRGAYTFYNIMETGRGCPHHCHYCSVTQFWGNKFRFRPVPEVIEEMKSLPPGDIVFIDDNMFGHPSRAKELFEAMIPLKRHWYGQGDLRLARDRELLDLANRAGCKWIFVGLETTDPENLKAMGKHSLNRGGDFGSAIATIQKAGINLFASFIVGMDHDDKTVFDHTLDFCIANRIGGANFYILTPLPGTQLFHEMESAGRLLHKNWSRYDTNHVVFEPTGMSQTDLLEGYIRLYRQFYSVSSIARRIAAKGRDLPEMLALNIGRRINFRHFAAGCRV
jgi:radical SAM superfamily enzyme YgiQ (UPF0313 family)